MSEVTVNRQIKLDNVRLLRVSLTKPYVGRDAKIDPATGKQDGKFHIDAVFPPTHPQFPALQQLIRDVATAKWKEQTQQTLDMISTVRASRRTQATCTCPQATRTSLRSW
jgi:hypothetical protein